MNSPLAPDLTFTPVDPRLIRVKILTELAAGLPLVIVSAALNLTVWRNHPWTWAITAVIVIATAWMVALWPRRVRAMGYVELQDELVIAKGIMFRRVEVVPYGRMQQVTVTAGPLLARYGLAKVNLVTASSESDGEIPAVSREEAERLRGKLTALGEAHMEGL
ncbi:PH domain-containing protein [Actinomycetaceae bacterium L2_0104]